MKKSPLVLYSGYCLLSLWCLLLLASCRLFSIQPLSLNATETLFFAVNYLGHFFLISLIATLLNALLLSIPGIRRYRLTVSTVIIAIAFCLALAVSVVYSVWRMGINNNLLQFAFAPDAGQVIEVSKGFIASLIAMLAIVLGIAFGAAKLSHYVSKKESHTVMKTCLIAGLLFFFAAQTWTFVDLRSGKANNLVLTQKLPQYHALSLASTINRWLPQTRAESLSNTVHALLQSEHPITMPPLVGHIPKHLPNILLIVVDTLRADMLSPKIMPHAFAFSHHADRFLKHFSGGNCTQPGVFSLFYSIPSTYWDSAIQTPKAPPLIARLQKLHYQIDLLSSAPLVVPNFQKTLFSTVKAPKPTPGEDAIARDEFVTQKTISILKRKDKQQKHFTFVFLDSVHSYNSLSQLSTPFGPQDALNYLTLTDHTNRAPIVNRYKNAVHFDDSLIGKMIQTLKNTGELKNTIVIITADHGQSFNDLKQNYWEHASNFARYELQVPLLIHWPKETPRIINYRTSHFDLAPTLWEKALGISDDPHPWSVGHNLYDHRSPRWIVTQNYTDTGVVSPKKIVTFYTTGNDYITNTHLKRLHQAIPQSAITTLMNQCTRFFAP